MLCGMQPHSTPASRPGQHCWHCTSFAALVFSGTAAKCLRDSRVTIQAAPATGWVFWQRQRSQCGGLGAVKMPNRRQQPSRLGGGRSYGRR
jgi:hypothetical protein